MKKVIILLFTTSIFFFASSVFAESSYISTKPETIIQGEPMMIQIENVSGVNDVARIEFNGKSLWFYTYAGKPTAIYGIDLNQKSGDYKITAKLENGLILEKIITIGPREKVEAPLGIPQKLGGNTPQAATNLVTNLTKENDVINNVRSINKKLWLEKFQYPTANPIVTDTYGYLRKTGYYTIPHKGADFRASDGTSVMAMERGIVRLAKTFTIYGKTIAIDHGLGVITYYMHLSKIKVSEGQLVKKGQEIGLSGQTGYAENPHLHISSKIDRISVDPIKLLEIFNKI